MIDTKLTKAQANLLSNAVLRVYLGKGLFVAEEFQAAENLARLGFVRISATPWQAVPMVFPTETGFAWIRERYLRGIPVSEAAR